MNTTQFTALLQDPDPAWAREITPQGLAPDVTGSALEVACEVTGQEPGEPGHTAVWLCLALAGRGMTSEPGAGVSLGTYLGHTRHGQAHLRAIIGPPDREGPAEAATLIGQILRAGEQGEAPLPDPLVLATDLADRLGPDPVAARDAARRWARSYAMAVKVLRGERVWASP